MLAVRESKLTGRRRSLIAGPLYRGNDASAESIPITLQRASASMNASATGLAQKVAATAERLYDVLPASKGQLQRSENRIQRDEDLIQKLVMQVNSLTPVSASLLCSTLWLLAAQDFERGLATIRTSNIRLLPH